MKQSFFERITGTVSLKNNKNGGDLISVTRELVTIKGERGAPAGIAGENYFYKELYWGAFSRTILLPQEIETEEVTATERHGLLTITLPKIDKAKVQKVKIKSL
ncbi:MAG: Protein containing Heat shock protein Hsp20 protein [Parcubacteria group bacterium GW2011_GWA1_47_8]|nr:MAG: Protein containing Heat shock protein Hsp20 protein [Parcubacteria group bacterium GW2011_GWA1_47_8]